MNTTATQRRGERILVSTLSNIACQVASLVAAFILMPLLIKYFGAKVFGLNAYVISLTTLLNFSMLAVSMSLMKYLPEFIAKGEHQAANETLTTVVCFSLLVHVLLGVAIFTLPYYGLDWFNVPIELQDIARRVMQIVGVFTVFLFLTPTLDGILTGLEQFHTRNMINLVLIASQIAAYAFVRVTGGSLPQFVFIVQTGMVLSVLLKIGAALRVLPFSIECRCPSKMTLRRVVRYNVFHVFNYISDQLMYTADKLILQKFLGPASVTFYHVARRAQEVSHSFISLPMGAIVPSISASYATNDIAYIRKANTAGSLLYGLLVVPPLIAWTALFSPFVNLWVGPSFRITILAGMLLLLTTVIGAPFKVFEHTLVAKGRVTALGWGKGVLAVANIVLSVVLVRKIGLIGVVIPTVGFWCCYPILLVLIMRTEPSVEMRPITQAMLPTLAVLATQGALYALLYRHVEVASWGGFLLVFAGIYVAGALMFLATALLLARTLAIEAFHLATMELKTVAKRLLRADQERYR
jgi:O-antigen/teichoic acid export membrane protein